MKISGFKLFIAISLIVIVAGGAVLLQKRNEEEARVEAGELDSQIDAASNAVRARLVKWLVQLSVQLNTALRVQMKKIK